MRQVPLCGGPTQVVCRSRSAKVPGGMSLEVRLVRLTMHELLDAANAADEQEAQQLLVAVVAARALMEVVARPTAERQAARGACATAAAGGELS